MARKEYEILMTEEGGFFFGRMLKNGTMSADSVRIDDDQVMKMFAEWFGRYCLHGQTDTLWIKDPEGAILVKRLPEEKIREAAAAQSSGSKGKRKSQEAL